MRKSAQPLRFMKIELKQKRSCPCRREMGLTNCLESADNLVVRSDRRENDRELCADLVKVQWKPEFGPSRSEWAILEDICASGACLEIEEPIALDTLYLCNLRANTAKPA